MKFQKTISVTLIMLLFSMVCSLSCKDNIALKEGNFKLIGTVKGMDEGQLYLGDLDSTETIYVKNGAFEFEGSMDGDEINEKGLAKNKEDFENFEDVTLYLEPKVMTIEIDMANLEGLKLTGSVTHSKSDELKKELNAISPEREANYKKYDDLYTELEEGEANGADAAELERLRKEIDAINEKLEILEEKKNKQFVEFIKRNPNSYISIELFGMLMQSVEPNEIKILYASLGEEIKNSEKGQGIAEYIKLLDLARPGMMAKNFTAIDVNGDELSLEQFRGNYVLLDFWGSWCAPCRMGNPHLLELYGQYKSKGFEIVGISDDVGAEDKWRKAIEEDKIGVWRHILRSADKSAPKEKDIANIYGISAYPTKVLVDPEGKIVGRYVGEGGPGEGLDEKLIEVY